MMYRPPAVVFYSVAGGVGKTTIATALAHHLSRRGPVLYISADFEKNDGTYRFVSSIQNHDWMNVLKNPPEPPFRLKTWLYIYDGNMAFKLYSAGKLEAAAAALPLVLHRLPHVLMTHRLPVFYVVVDVMRGYPLVSYLGGAKIRGLELLKKFAKLVFVASYDEHEVMKSRGSQIYTAYIEYADMVVMNRVPPSVLKRMSAEYAAVAPELAALRSVHAAEEAARVLSKRGLAKAGGRVVNLLDGISMLFT